jgi:hypothetical protein
MKGANRGIPAADRESTSNPVEQTAVLIRFRSVSEE